MEQFVIQKNLPCYYAKSADEYLSWVFRMDKFYYESCKSYNVDYKNLKNFDLNFCAAAIKKIKTVDFSEYPLEKNDDNWDFIKRYLCISLLPDFLQICEKIQIILRRQTQYDTIISLYDDFYCLLFLLKRKYHKKYYNLFEYKILTDFINGIKCKKLKWLVKCKMPKSLAESLLICREFCDIDGFRNDKSYFRVNNSENVILKSSYEENSSSCKTENSETSFCIKIKGGKESNISNVVNNFERSPKNLMSKETITLENQNKNTLGGNVVLKRKRDNIKLDEIFPKRIKIEENVEIEKKNEKNQIKNSRKACKIDRVQIRTNYLGRIRKSNKSVVIHNFKYKFQKFSESLNKNKRLTNIYSINKEEDAEKTKDFRIKSSETKLKIYKDEEKSSKYSLEIKNKCSENEIQINNSENFDNILINKKINDSISVKISNENYFSENLAKNRCFDTKEYKNINSGKHQYYSNSCLKPMFEISSFDLKNYKFNSSANDLLSIQEKHKFRFMNSKEKLIYKKYYIKKRKSRYKFRKKVLKPKIRAKYKDKRTGSNKKNFENIHDFPKNSINNMSYKVILRKTNNYCDHFDDKYIRKRNIWNDFGSNSDDNK